MLNQEGWCGTDTYFMRYDFMTIVSDILDGRKNKTGKAMKSLNRLRTDRNSTNWMSISLLLWLQIEFVAGGGKTVVGFDCSIGESAYQEISLLDVKKCQNLSSQYGAPTPNRIQIIQRVEFEAIEVMNCKAHLTFEAAYCGLNIAQYSLGWDSVELGADMSALITKSQCAEAFITQRLKIYDRGDYGSKDKEIEIQLDSDLTASGTLILRGTEKMETSTCTGESFYFDRRMYASHVLKMRYKVAVQMKEGTLSHRMNTLRIPGGITTAQLKEGYIFDKTQGNFHFAPIHQGNTSTEEYSEVARGTADVYEPRNKTETQRVAVVEMMGPGGERQLAMLLRREQTLCIKSQCKVGYETHLRGVFLIIVKLGSSHYKLNEVKTEDVNELLNIQATQGTIYINQQMKLAATFDHLANLLCLQSRQVMLTNIAQYAIRGSGEAEGKQGKLLLKAGSIAYMIQCKEVLVELQTNISQCYEEVPVTYKAGKGVPARDMFLDPVSYNLKPVGKRQKCADLTPNKYGLITAAGEREWFCLSERGWRGFPSCMPPPELNPMYVGQLYQTELHFIDTDLYSTEQMDAVRQKMWENNDQDAFSRDLTTIARKMAGNQGTHEQMTKLVTRVIERAQEQVRQSLLPSIFLVFIFIWDKLGALMVATFFVNMCMNIAGVVGRARRIYKETGTYSWRLLCCLTNGLFLVALPVRQECKCATPEYLDQLMGALQERERAKLIERIYSL